MDLGRAPVRPTRPLRASGDHHPPVILRDAATPFADRTARRAGDVIYADQRDAHHARSRRHFWLLDHGIRIVYEPFGWTNEWRIDLLAIKRSTHSGTELFLVRDMAIELIVEGMGPRYRVMALDEMARRLGDGRISPDDARDAFARTTTFLDAFLHRSAPWPPPPILPFFSPDHMYP